MMWKKSSKEPANPSLMLDSIQIEITSRCSLKCVMCPNISVPGWNFKDMDFETFERISMYFPYAKLIYLQGWGEPLLHKRIFDMIGNAKDAGCRVGFTSNGTLLKKDTCEKLIELGLDIIVISIAGSGKDAHESIRVGSNFDKIIKNVGRLNGLKAELSSNVPKINLSFLMTKSNILELSGVIELANELGVGEVVATNLDYVSTPAQDEIRVFSCNLPDEKYEEKIKEASIVARKYGITFRPYPLGMEELVMCELNPVNQIFVSCEGYVSPCNYINFPTEGRIPRMFCGKKHGISRTYYGDISREDFFKIWEKPEYQEFRQRYARRIIARDRAFFGLDVDADPFEIREAEKKLREDLKSLPVPDVCRTCYKAFGI